MLRVLLVFLLLTSVSYCAFAQNSTDDQIIGCQLNERRLYRYEALVNTFGNTPDHDDDGDAGRFLINSDVGLTCFYNVPKRNGKALYFWEFDMKNVQITQQEHRAADGWKSNTTLLREDEIPNYHTLDEHFAKFSAFVSTSNGKMVNLIMSKSEPLWVKTIKKGIIGQLQVKLTGSERDEKGPLGTHRSHYRKFRRGDGSTVIEKEVTEADLTKKKGFRRRDMRLRSKTGVVLDRRGHFQRIVKWDKVDFGADSTNMHKVFSINRHIPWAKNTHWDADNKDFLKAEGVSELNFVNITESDYEFKNYLVPPATDDATPQSDDAVPETSMQIVAKTRLLNDDLAIEKFELKGLKSHSRAVRRQMVRSSINLNELLKKLKLNTEDMNLAARIGEYVQAVPTKATIHNLKTHFDAAVSKIIAHRRYRKTSSLADNDDEDNATDSPLAFAKLIQTFLTSSRSKRGQKMLLETMKPSRNTPAELIIHGIFRTLGIKKPIPEIETALAALKDYESPSNNTKTASYIRLNAYLALADLASRMKDDAALNIVNFVLGNLKQASSVDELVLHINALGNAGSRVPLDILAKFIKSRVVDDAVRVAAVNALRKRVDPQEDDAVNKLIHTVVKGKRFSPVVKVEAVNVQTNREEQMKTGASVPVFKNFLLDVVRERLNKRIPKQMELRGRVDPRIKAAVMQYMRTVGSKEAGDIVSAALYFRDPVVLSLLGFQKKESNVVTVMSDAFATVESQEALYEQLDDFSDLYSAMSEADAKFLKKVGKAIGNAAKAVGNAVGNAAKAVGNAVGNVASNIGNTVADAAKKLGKAASNIYDAATNAIKDVTEIWSGATWKGNQVCLPAGGSNICMYDSDMISFVGSQGNLANLKQNRKFTFERLIGAQKLHMYVGAVGFAGTSFSCKNPPATFEYAIFARAAAKAHVFGRDLNLLSVSFENGYVGGKRRDKVYLKVFNSVMFDRSLIQKEFTLCDSRTKQLVHKDYPELVSFKTMIVIVVVPVEFGVKAFGSFDLSLYYNFCIDNLAASGKIVPKVTLGASGYAAVSVAIAKAGVSVDASINYSIYPELRIEGLQCRLCGGLYTETKPIKVDVNGFAELNIAVVKKSFKKTIFSHSAPTSKSTVFEQCLAIPNK